MPYAQAEYIHERRKDPRKLVRGTFRTVPISHTNARVRYPAGTQAIVGKSRKTGNWVIQSVLIPKRLKGD